MFKQNKMLNKSSLQFLFHDPACIHAFHFIVQQRQKKTIASPSIVRFEINIVLSKRNDPKTLFMFTID